MASIAVPVALALAVLGGQGATASAGPAQASGAKTVEIRHFAFHPRTIEVGRGARVVFSNASRAVHTATDRGAFDTGRIGPDTSLAVRFERRGTFAYHCKIHRFMRGKVVVR